MSTVLIVIAVYIFLITVIQIGLIIKGNIDAKTVKTYDWNPSVSIVIPCYNEESSILSCVRSALHQDYENFDVIVVDDGSTDSSAQLLIEKYGLSEISENVFQNGILTLIKKENGGKFSALNVGMDYSTADRILNVDADSLIVSNALEMLTKYTSPDAAASTAAIGIINGCEVNENGGLLKKRIPFRWLVVSQMIEYLRTFVMLKLALNKNNGIMVLSGACTFFNREFVQSIGGYREKITEDAELTLRIHKNGGVVQFVPAVLSYTECPENRKMLARQRYRWIRGIIRDAWEHRQLLKGKTAIGRFMIPYFYITDLLFPWFEFIGWALFIWTILFGTFSIPIVVMFLAFVISLYIINNMVLLWVSNKWLKSFQGFENKWFVYFVAAIDYIYYRPIMVFLVLSSQIKEIFRTASPWGKLTRKGF